jgi:hypothetical protein
MGSIKDVLAKRALADAPFVAERAHQPLAQSVAPKDTWIANRTAGLFLWQLFR